MGYLEGMHQAIDQNLCCPQGFTSQLNALFLLVSVWKSSLPSEEVHSSFNAIGPKGFYKVWLSENNANDAEVKHYVVNDIPFPVHIYIFFNTQLYFNSTSC